MIGTRFRAILGLAATRLRHDRTRTVLAVLGVTLAVLSTTLLGSVGVGVVETGQQKFDSADRDLWISGGPTRIAPGTLGGFQGGIPDAHSIGTNISRLESVSTATPLLFQTVYIGSEPDNLQSIVAVGIPSSGGISITSGSGFADDNSFYNNGQYNGTPSQTLVVGSRLENTQNYSIGDSLHVGGTVLDARQTQYNVTGTSSTFSTFLGTPTVALPLAELQAMTGNQATDRASLITVDVASDASVSVVRERLENTYPQFTIRSNSEQLQTIIGSRIVIVAAGVTLVALAVLSGLVLTTNLLALLVIQEREVLAALQAMGVSRRVATMLIVTQGLCYALLGCMVGIVLTFPLGWALNRVTAELTGFGTLVQISPVVLVAGAGIALIAGVVSTTVAGLRAMAISPLEVLSR